jgi:2-keto-4-pentenoate hydratase
MIEDTRRGSVSNETVVSSDRQYAETLAERIWQARSRQKTIPPLSAEINLNLELAYEIQEAVLRRREASGERRIGYKLGYTSVAMREQMGVKTMNFGVLTDAMMLRSGDQVKSNVMQPGVEPEIAFIFRRGITAPATREDVMDSVGEVRAALEVVDAVWTDYRFNIEDNTADGSSACHVALGPKLPREALEELPVVLSKNGAKVAEATGAAASGHPAEGVRWLCEALSDRGTGIRSGELVITGGLTRAVALNVGDVVRATFDGSHQVAVKR